jgi:N-carbamoyl-L-amino-acid hydrolase
VVIVPSGREAREAALRQPLFVFAARADAARSFGEGAGDDAAVFAYAGIPSAMMFVRNENGSHNPKKR